MTQRTLFVTTVDHVFSTCPPGIYCGNLISAPEIREMSFHEGDLQSGIAAAIQQQKAVLCFVHGGSIFTTTERSLIIL